MPCSNYSLNRSRSNFMALLSIFIIAITISCDNSGIRSEDRKLSTKQQYEVGRARYYDNPGNDSIQENALNLVRYSASKGNLDAIYFLGNLLSQYSQLKDKHEGYDWLLKAAELNHPRAYSLAAYGYEVGDFETGKDIQKALKLREKGADLGDSFSMHALGATYEFGKGVPVDFNRALYYYSMAETAGVAQASQDISRVQSKK